MLAVRFCKVQVISFVIAIACAILPKDLYAQYLPQNMEDQTADSSVVRICDIVVIGNKITKEHIILRELEFRSGDAMMFTSFKEKKNRSEENLINTSLFNSVHITWLVAEQHELTVYIILKERWYIFPLPIFEVIDRNFNVWWQTKDFSRVVYGGALTWNNFRGRNEFIEAGVRLGYVQRIHFIYSIPYINRRQNSGLKFYYSYSRNRQTPFATVDDKQVFYKNEETFSRRQQNAGLEYTYRHGLYQTHFASLGYIDAQVEDTIIKLNPDFFSHSKSSNSFTVARYMYKLDHRDIVSYPLRGYEFDIELVKAGLPFLNDDIDIAYSTFNLRKYWQVSPSVFASAGLRGKVSSSAFQPYFNTRALGYNRDYVRGYEYYVADGQHFALLKTTIKYKLMSTRNIYANWIPLEKFSVIPFAFYFNVHSDAAYVDDNQFYAPNRLPNSILLGYGAGIDLVTYYDIVLRLEYSFNKFGESGLFLHFSAAI